jgi:formylmethanofuran dehydrogenase subunit A
MTTTLLKGGRVFDPINGIDGEVRDLHIRDGRIVEPPSPCRGCCCPKTIAAAKRP